MYRGWRHSQRRHTDKPTSQWKNINLSSRVITDLELASYLKAWNFVFQFYGKNIFTVRSWVNGYACISASLYYFDKKFTVNVHCGIGSIPMQVSSHIHNEANRTIAKNGWQIYFKKFEVLTFLENKMGAIRTGWKIYSCIFYHLCIMVTIFQVVTSLSIFSTTIPSLAYYRKQMKSNYRFTYANWNINLIIGFRNHA